MDENIVLISVDSLRADSCPWLAGSEVDTPVMSSASKSGISFTNAFSPGHATPMSMPQIFTGHYLPRVNDNEPNAQVSASHKTIPEMLSARGYSTIGFTPNPFTSREFGFDAGFDHFEDFLNRDTTVLGRLRSYVRDNWKNKIGGGLRLGLNLLGQGDITVSWRDYYSEIIDAVENSTEPFFLWVFLLEPHWPYFPSSKYRGDISLRNLFMNYKRSRMSDAEMTTEDKKLLLKLYRRTIADVDDFVGQLQSDLSEYEPTYIFHSDHGESFGERGYWGHEGPLFKENIHVPLEIWNTRFSQQIQSPISLRRLPKIIDKISEGRVEEIASLTSTYASARNWDEISIGGNNWFHYPDRGYRASPPLQGVGDKIIEKEREQIKEERRLRTAGRKVADQILIDD